VVEASNLGEARLAYLSEVVLSTVKNVTVRDAGMNSKNLISLFKSHCFFLSDFHLYNVHHTINSKLIVNVLKVASQQFQFT